MTLLGSNSLHGPPACEARAGSFPPDIDAAGIHEPGSRPSGRLARGKALPKAPPGTPEDEDSDGDAASTCAPGSRQVTLEADGQGELDLFWPSASAGSASHERQLSSLTASTEGPPAPPGLEPLGRPRATSFGSVEGERLAPPPGLAPGASRLGPLRCPPRTLEEEADEELNEEEAAALCGAAASVRRFAMVGAGARPPPPANEESSDDEEVVQRIRLAARRIANGRVP